MDYKIVATNDGSLAANTGKLTDKPDFAKGLEIQSAKIAETQAGLDSAADATATGGIYTLTDGVELAPKATKEYWIRFAVVRNPAAAGYNEADLACSVNGNDELAPGKGLFNEVLAENGKDSDGTSNNKACGPTVPHDFVVIKAGTQNTGKTFADASNQYTGPNGVTLYPLDALSSRSTRQPQHGHQRHRGQDPDPGDRDRRLLLVRQRPEPRHHVLAR